MKRRYKTKAQGLSMNTIIIAALGLAVLVVLFAVFTGRIGLFSKGVSQADTCQQKCLSLNKQFLNSPPETASTCTPGDGKTFVGGTYSDVTAEDQVCCCR